MMIFTRVKVVLKIGDEFFIVDHSEGLSFVCCVGLVVMGYLDYYFGHQLKNGFLVDALLSFALKVSVHVMSTVRSWCDLATILNKISNCLSVVLKIFMKHVVIFVTHRVDVMHGTVSERLVVDFNLREVESRLGIDFSTRAIVRFEGSSDEGPIDGEVFSGVFISVDMSFATSRPGTNGCFFPDGSHG